jgi:Electron transfer flavoprotein domain
VGAVDGSAEAALREAVALGVTRAVLLCDRLWAGSDTWATSNALAAAICQLGGADPVLCGNLRARRRDRPRWRTTCANCRSSRRTARSTEPHSLTVARRRASRSVAIMTASSSEILDRSVAPNSRPCGWLPVAYEYG